MPDRFLTHRSRRHASVAMRAPGPGRYLAVEDGNETVLLALRPGLTRIGRSGAADIAFDDGSISRRHAVVMTRSDGSAEVRDDGSLNGTFVNGDRVRRQVLHDGDELTVGRRSMRYVEVRMGETLEVGQETERLAATTAAA